MGVKLAYIDAKTSGGVTWYKVSYGVNTGWLMGTYVNASGSGSSSGGNSGSGGSSSGSVTVTGKVEITKVSTGCARRRRRQDRRGAGQGLRGGDDRRVRRLRRLHLVSRPHGQRDRLCARRLRHRGRGKRRRLFLRRQHGCQPPQVHHPSYEYLSVHDRQPDRLWP